MATYNISRKANNNKKREVSVAVYRVDLKDQVYVTGDVLQLGIIPKGSQVTNAVLRVTEVCDAAASTAAVALTGGAVATVATGFALTGLTVASNAPAQKVSSNDAIVTTTLTLPAAYTKGAFEVLIQYIEPDLTTAQLTSFVE